MKKIIVMLCVLIVVLPLYGLPIQIQAESLDKTNLDVGMPYRVVSESQLVNITGTSKKIIDSSALSALKRTLAKSGWKPAGKPFFSTGKWLLKFSRTIITYDGIFINVLMPNMYWDSIGNCARYKSNGQPIPGMRCRAIS